jgi:hypothetical protein
MFRMTGLDYLVMITLAASYQKERFSSDRNGNGILGRLIAFRALLTRSPDSIAGQEDTPAQGHDGANAVRTWTEDEMRLLQEGLVRQMAFPEIQENLPGKSAVQIDKMR